jgi:Ca-activated chloride channel family protein
MLNLLWLLPLVAVALIIQNRKKKKAMEMFADIHLLVRLTARGHRGRRFFKALLLLLALGLMLFALAGPRWGSHYEEVSQKGVDIMILVDVSPSMLVEDITPNRLERARREILDLLRVVQGDRLGLVVFSGAAFIQCPLTLDYAALEMFLNAIQPDLIPVPGTDLGAAIDTGLSAFDDDAATDRVILLITDGEDNEKQGFEAARRAAAGGAKIFVFGIGDAAGGPIPELDGGGGLKKDSQGKLILSRLQEEELREIASLTGGTYVRSIAGDLDLDILYFDGIKSRTEAQELKSGKIKVYEERFAFFVLAAFIILLIEGFIDEKFRSRAASKGKAAVARAGFWLVIYLVIHAVSAIPSPAAESPDELYRQGRFAEAEKAYAQLDMDHPRNIRYRYNRGCAAYQNNDYQSAAAAFASVLRRSQDPEIRFKATYNLGNATYKQGDYESAAKYYKQAIADNPSNEDARYNLELTLRALEKQKDLHNRKKKDQPQQDTGQQQNQSDDNKKQLDEGQQSKGKSSEQKPTSKQKKESDAGVSKPEEQKTSGQAQKKQSPATRPSGQKPQSEMAGELKLRDSLPPVKEDAPIPETAMSGIDKKKAEALLDNIQENRSRLLQLQIPGEKRHGVASGKDW